MLYKLDNITRVYDTRTVVNITELSIEAGKIYTLIGPNGAGKTSLLKILAFLDKPTTGQIHFLNQPAYYKKNSLFELRRQVVLLDQNPIMFSGSVESNVEFGLKARNIPKDERNVLIGQALENVGMGHFRDYEAKSLSGGETKRVALARALVLQPKVLLCDEPTANVDSENQEIILNVLTELNQKHNCSVIFSTHYLSQAQRLADHTLLLQHGSLSNIVNENIYKITVADKQKDHIVCQLSGQVYLKLPEKMLPHGEGAMKLHIDPEQILLHSEDGVAGDGNKLQGHLTELSQDRGRVRLTIDVGVIMILMLSMESYLKVKPAIGDKVAVGIPDSSLSCTRVGSK